MYFAHVLSPRAAPQCLTSLCIVYFFLEPRETQGSHFREPHFQKCPMNNGHIESQAASSVSSSPPPCPLGPSGQREAEQLELRLQVRSAVDSTVLEGTSARSLSLCSFSRCFPQGSRKLQLPGKRYPRHG